MNLSHFSVDEKSGADNQKGSQKGIGRDLSISRIQDFAIVKKFLWGAFRLSNNGF
jgi:hypothetical protein